MQRLNFKKNNLLLILTNAVEDHPDWIEDCIYVIQHGINLSRQFELKKQLEKIA